MVAEEGAARLAEVADDGDEEAHDEDDREEQLVEPTRGAVRSKQFFPAFHALVIPPGNRGGFFPAFKYLQHDRQSTVIHREPLCIKKHGIRSHQPSSTSPPPPLPFCWTSAARCLRDVLSGSTRHALSVNITSA